MFTIITRRLCKKKQLIDEPSKRPNIATEHRKENAMQFKDLATGDVFAVIAPSRSPLFRKTHVGGVEEVRGGDISGKIISKATKVTIKLNQEVQLIDQGAITGKARS